MKQKTTPPEGQPKEALRQRRERALRRQQKRREQKKKGEFNERKAIFDRRLKKASARTAPVTQRTRGYYRFTRDFPGTVDENGLRENGRRKKSVAKILLWVLGLAAVFCLAFTLTKAAWLVSNEAPVVTAPTETAEPQALPFRAVLIPRDKIETATADSVKKTLEEAGAQTAVLEVKDAYGYIYVYDTLIPQLHRMDISAAAYISCFQDSFHTWDTPALSVRTLNEYGGAWTDNSGAGWLNPFSAEARGILLDTVKSAADAGFDYILLDNVCFPADSGSASAYYAGESDYNGTRNQVLTGFISDAVSAAGKAATILLSRFSAFDAEAGADRAPTYGDLLHTAAGVLAADVRLSGQPKNVTVGEETFADPADLPYAFTLAVAEFTVKNAPGSRVVLCMDNDRTAKEAVKAAEYAGVEGWILW